jgi:hypothetical protein
MSVRDVSSVSDILEKFVVCTGDLLFFFFFVTIAARRHIDGAVWGFCIVRGSGGERFRIVPHILWIQFRGDNVSALVDRCALCSWIATRRRRRRSVDEGFGDFFFFFPDSGG